MVEVSGRKRTERITERDLGVLEFVGRFGVIPRQVVAEWAETGRAVTAARERRLREAGLVDVLPGLGDSGRLVLCTRRGLGAVGLEELATPRFSPATLNHSSIVTRVAVQLEGAGHCVLSEREIEARERAEGRRVLSAECRSGRYHRPDLVILPPDSPSASDWGAVWPSSSRTKGGQRGERTSLPGRGSEVGRSPVTNSPTERERKTGDRLLREQDGSTEDTEIRRIPGASKPIAIEVELTDKSARRLDAILRAWRRSLGREQFAGVRYRCSPRALPYLERAVARLGGEWAIDVEPLNGRLGGTAALRHGF